MAIHQQKIAGVGDEVVAEWWSVTAIWWSPHRDDYSMWVVDSRSKVCSTEDTAQQVTDLWRKRGRVPGNKGPVRSFRVHVAHVAYTTK